MKRIKYFKKKLKNQRIRLKKKNILKWINNLKKKDDSYFESEKYLLELEKYYFENFKSKQINMSLFKTLNNLVDIMKNINVSYCKNWRIEIYWK